MFDFVLAGKAGCRRATRAACPTKMRLSCQTNVLKDTVALCCVQEEWAAAGLQGLPVSPSHQGLHDPGRRLHQGRR
jgi:hypothetical protein